MRSRSSPEVSGDAEPVNSRSTRARLSPPDASDVLAPLAAVPRVMRAAAAALRSTPASALPGYSPRVSMDMLGAHCWVPYAATIRVLRSLFQQTLKGARSREAVREAIAELYGRFPAGEVYVCLDRAPLVRKMQRIQESLIKAEAAEYGEEFVSACSSYIYGIGDALDDITRVDDRASSLPSPSSPNIAPGPSSTSPDLAPGPPPISTGSPSSSSRRPEAPPPPAATPSPLLHRRWKV